MVSTARIKRTCPRCKHSFEASSIFCPNDGTALEPRGEAPPDSDPYIGTVIQGDIEIKSVAGAGAMGRVYRAYQRGIDRDVAVKILHRELSGNQALVQRFHREAKIASKLQHPHVVEVYLAGQLPDGSLYMAMEYLDGLSLAAATTATGGRMPLERALPIILQVCDAVGEGHSRGIVHRDLKPENVMLVRRADTSDWVKVLDFGIAKVSLGEQSMETAAGLIFGTARYISPEGAQGTTVGPPGDVYALAVILYQLLSGLTPFDAEQPVGLLIKHIHEPPPPLQSLPEAADIAEPIARVIMDNLAKDPSLRAPTARALGNAIAAAAREANVSFSDIGVVARMSMVDLSSPQRSSGSDRTLDAPPTPDVEAPPLTRASAHVERSSGGATPVEGSSAASDFLSEPRAPTTALRSRRRFIGVVTMSFLLGVVLTAFSMRFFTGIDDHERMALIGRARHALANGNYIEPPGDNVRDLVRSGLTRWPDDSDLVKLQSDAAHEIVTRAMAARSGGDVTGALALAQTARDLDPTDGTARLLLSQYGDELAAAAADAGRLQGARVTLEISSGRIAPGNAARFVAQVSLNGNLHETSEAQFVVTGPGLAPDGLVIPATDSNPYRATFTPTVEGEYEVEFEASLEGVAVRAKRALSVAQ